MKNYETKYAAKTEIVASKGEKSPSWFFGSTWALLSLISIIAVLYLGLMHDSWAVLFIGMGLIAVGMFKFSYLLGVLAPLSWFSLMLTNNFQSDKRAGLDIDVSDYLLAFAFDTGLQFAACLFVSLFLVKKEI